MAYIYDLTDTWNAGGTTFNAIKMNVTDSASAVSSKLVSLQTNGTEHFSVTKAGVGYVTGPVGIGTSSPLAGYRLDVLGSANASGSFISGGGTVNQAQIGNKTLLFYNTSVSEGLIQTSDDTSTFNSIGIDKATVRFLTVNNERMRISVNGGVAIGTSVVDSRFQVELPGVAGMRIGFDNTPVNYFDADTQIFRSTAVAERMRIDSSGNLLVGKTSTSFGRLEVAASSEVAAFQFTGTIGTLRFLNASAGTIGSIQWSGTTTTYNTSSDVRLKHDIADAPEASSIIDAIQVRSFKWNADNSEQRYGFVAQELVTVAPEAVSQPEDPEEMMGVDYSKLVPMLVKEIQSLRARVAQLEGS